MPNWKDVLEEIQKVRSGHSEQAKAAVDIVRRAYLKQLHQHTGRNVIAYYSGFLSKPGIDAAEITDEDKNGFMMAVHKLDRKIRSRFNPPYAGWKYRRHGIVGRLSAQNVWP